MTEQREFNASNAEEALENAAAALNVDRESLSYKVLDNGSSGFLGLGVRDARVLVDIPEAGADESGSDQSPPQEIISQKTSTEERLSEETTQGEAAGSPENQNTHEENETQENSEELVTGAEAPLDPRSGEETEPASAELLESVRSHVEAVLDAMAFESEVSIRDDGEVIVAEIESEDAGLLIGQKGETIDALQYLINSSFHKDRQSPKRILLDCEGYRERRLKAVQGMAHRTAKRVYREGTAIDLPRMSSSERRAVHSYLKDNPSVTTASAGKDENRRVTISPS